MSDTSSHHPAAPRRLRREDTVLMIVDVQERFVPAIHEGEAIVERCALLARAAHLLKLPVVIAEQNPERLGATRPEILEAGQLQEAERIAKMSFSAWTPGIQAAIAATGRRTLLLCGIETHVCVLQTSLDLLENGYQVFAAHDAISSRRVVDRDLGRQRLQSAGVVPASAESAIFELLREAGTPEFKALLPFIK